MSKKEIIEKVKQYAVLVKRKLPVKMVILQKAYPGAENKRDFEIEVAVVVENMEKDLVEAKDELIQLANQVDSRIDPILIEKDKEDPTGFFDAVLKTGRIIYQE